MTEKQGKFEKGNQIGKETRFAKGNTLSKKYKTEFADSLFRYFLDSQGSPIMPTLEEWAIVNHIDIRTAYYWISDEEKYPRFASVYAQCKALQKSKLIQLGLTELYNAQIVKFLLTNNHGMSEKAVSDTTVTYKIEVDNAIDEESN